MILLLLRVMCNVASVRVVCAHPQNTQRHRRATCRACRRCPKHTATRTHKPTHQSVSINKLCMCVCVSVYVCDIIPNQSTAAATAAAVSSRRALHPAAPHVVGNVHRRDGVHIAFPPHPSAHSFSTRNPTLTLSLSLPTLSISLSLSPRCVTSAIRTKPEDGVHSCSGFAYASGFSQRHTLNSTQCNAMHEMCMNITILYTLH